MAPSSILLGPRAAIAPGVFFSGGRCRISRRRLELANRFAAAAVLTRQLQQQLARNVGPPIVRSPRRCAFEGASGAEAKPKVRRLRTLELLTPFGQQLALLLLAEESGLISRRPLGFIAGISEIPGLEPPPRRRPPAVPVAREQVLAIARPCLAVLRLAVEGVPPRILAVARRRAGAPGAKPALGSTATECDLPLFLTSVGRAIRRGSSL